VASRAELKRELLELLEVDEEFRYAVAGKLGLLELLRRLDKLEQGQERLWRSVEKLWEEVRALREEQVRIWQNIERLEERLSRVERGQAELREDLEELRRGQERLWKYVKGGFEGVRRALGVSFEEYAASFIGFMLDELGYPEAKVELRKPVLHRGRIVEFDILCEEPLVVAEATLRLESKEEAEAEVKKLMERAEVAAEVFGKRPLMLVLAVGNAPEEVVERLRERAAEHGFKLLIGREMREVF